MNAKFNNSNKLKMRRITALALAISLSAVMNISVYAKDLDELISEKTQQTEQTEQTEQVEQADDAYETISESSSSEESTSSEAIQNVVGDTGSSSSNTTENKETNKKIDESVESITNLSDKMGIKIEDKDPIVVSLSSTVGHYVGIFVTVCVYLAFALLPASTMLDALYLMIPPLRGILDRSGGSAAGSGEGGLNGGNVNTYGGGYGNNYGGGYGGGYGNHYGGGYRGNQMAQQQNPGKGFNLVSPSAIKAAQLDGQQAPDGKVRNKWQIYFSDAIWNTIFATAFVVLIAAQVPNKIGIAAGVKLTGWILSRL